MKIKQQKLLIKALESATTGIFVAERNGCIIWVNNAFCQLSGYSPEAAIGQTPNILNSGKQRPEFYRVLWETILSGRPWQGEIVERHKNGNLYTVHQAITPLFDDTGNITHFIACHHGIRSRRQEEEEIRRLAYYDNLTNLPNRKLLIDLINRAIDHAHLDKSTLALMFLDLDHFKPINDELGHAMGDRLLVAVAERLRSTVRKTDTVARLGGDEFIILLTDMGNVSIADELARKLIARIAEPYMIDGKKLEISVSIGISLFPRDGDSSEVLLSCADTAMYAAKAEGHNRARFFDPSFVPHDANLDKAAL